MFCGSKNGPYTRKHRLYKVAISSYVSAHIEEYLAHAGTGKYLLIYKPSKKDKQESRMKIGQHINLIERDDMGSCEELKK